MAPKPTRRDLAPLRASDAPSLRRLARCFRRRENLLSEIAANVVDKIAARLEDQAQSPLSIYCPARYTGEAMGCALSMGHEGLHDDGKNRWG